MNLSKLFWWIYQLPLGEILRVFLVCTLMFLWINQRLEDRRWWRGCLAAVLMIWAAIVLWATLLNRSGGTMGAFQLAPFHSYREVLATGNREILRSNFMNVVLFFPAGLLFAAILPKRRRAAVAIVIFAVFSLSIETAQYALSLGRAELDDVIHNTLGAVCGYLAFFWGAGYFPGKKTGRTRFNTNS